MLVVGDCATDAEDVAADAVTGRGSTTDHVDDSWECLTSCLPRRPRPGAPRYFRSSGAVCRPTHSDPTTHLYPSTMPVVDLDGAQWFAIFQGKDDLFNLPKLDRATVAGISVAIAGNILISLALNCQKLAHRRLELEREHARDSLDRKPTPDRPINGSNALGITEEEDIEYSTDDDPSSSPDDTENDTATITPSNSAALETEPLLGHTGYSTPTYGPGEPVIPIATKPPWYTRLSPWRRRAGQMVREAEHAHLGSAHSLVPVDIVTIRPKSSQREDSGGSSESNGNESDYLRSKLWCAYVSVYHIPVVYSLTNLSFV